MPHSFVAAIAWLTAIPRDSYRLFVPHCLRLLKRWTALLLDILGLLYQIAQDGIDGDAQTGALIWYVAGSTKALLDES